VAGSKFSEGMFVGMNSSTFECKNISRGEHSCWVLVRARMPFADARDGRDGSLSSCGAGVGAG